MPSIFVSLSDHLHISKTTFICMSPVAMAQSCSGDNAILYILSGACHACT